MANYRNQVSKHYSDLSLRACVRACVLLWCGQESHVEPEDLWDREWRQRARPFNQQSWNQTGFQTLSKSIPPNFRDVPRPLFSDRRRGAADRLPLKAALVRFVSLSGRGKWSVSQWSCVTPPPPDEQRRGGFTPPPACPRPWALLLRRRFGSQERAWTQQKHIWLILFKWALVSLRLVVPVNWQGGFVHPKTNAFSMSE